MKERETEFVISFSVDDIEALLEALYSVDNQNTEEKAAYYIFAHICTNDKTSYLPQKTNAPVLRTCGKYNI